MAIFIGTDMELTEARVNKLHLPPDCQVVQTGMVGLAPKWGRLDPKLEKIGTFSDQISVHLDR